MPLREDLAFQLRYSAFEQKITLPNYLNDCNNINPDFANTFPTPAAVPPRGRSLWPGLCRALLAAGLQTNCFAFGQASLPVRVELANGAYLTSSVGYGFTYNTLDNNKDPDQRHQFQLRPGYCRRRRRRGLYAHDRRFPGLLRGRVRPHRPCAFARRRHDRLESDAASRKCACWTTSRWAPILFADFQPAGLGPRDITPGTTGDNIGGTKYWGASLEFQYPFYFLPKDQASGAPSSSIPDRYGATRARPKIRQPEK